MQYRPSAAELLAAIAELLEDEVIDALKGPVQHKARVAANLARILEREALLADSNNAHERAMLAGLGIADTGSLDTMRAHLSGQLRAGASGSSNADIWNALMDITRGDLAICKPGHDDWTGE